MIFLWILFGVFSVATAFNCVRWVFACREYKRACAAVDAARDELMAYEQLMALLDNEKEIW